MLLKRAGQVDRIWSRPRPPDHSASIFASTGHYYEMLEASSRALPILRCAQLESLRVQGFAST